jgi:hypothetical protein
MTIKGCDVFSDVGNANVGHSDDKCLFDNRHSCTYTFILQNELSINVKMTLVHANVLI